MSNPYDLSEVARMNSMHPKDRSLMAANRRVDDLTEAVKTLSDRIAFLEQHNQELSTALVQEKKLVRRYRREAV